MAKKKNSNSIVGKIGYCDNSKLGINKTGGHYVYINKDNKNGTCNVNVVTSLESSPCIYSNNKLNQVRKGNTYAIPFYDSNFSKWSGITRKPINNINTYDIFNIGSKNIKSKHKSILKRFF